MRLNEECETIWRSRKDDFRREANMNLVCLAVSLLTEYILMQVTHLAKNPSLP